MLGVWLPQPTSPRHSAPCVHLLRPMRHGLRHRTGRPEPRPLGEPRSPGSRTRSTPRGSCPPMSASGGRSRLDAPTSAAWLCAARVPVLAGSPDRREGLSLGRPSRRSSVLSLYRPVRKSEERRELGTGEPQHRTIGVLAVAQGYSVAKVCNLDALLRVAHAAARFPPPHFIHVPRPPLVVDSVQSVCLCDGGRAVHQDSSRVLTLDRHRPQHVGELVICRQVRW